LLVGTGWDCKDFGDFKDWGGVVGCHSVGLNFFFIII